MATPQEPQRFVERRQPEGSSPSEVPSELVVWQARQRFALTLGAVVLILLLVGGGMAIFLLREWRTSVVQAPPLPKPSSQFAQTPPPPSLSTNPTVASPMETPPPPIVTAQPSQPPMPLPPPTLPQHLPSPPPPPKAVLDYLEQLRRIEVQRKQDAKNIWLAIAALGELAKALQGIASSGDILDAPANYDPQKTLQTFATYQTAFAQLHRRLQQLQPPSECLPLHQAYDQALQAHITIIGKLQERAQMKDLMGTAMMGITAQGQITGALQAADGELAAVCARYGIQKFFTIGDE